MMTTVSLCVSCEFSRAVFVYYGGAPTILNMALLRLNLALGATVPMCPPQLRHCRLRLCYYYLPKDNAYNYKLTTLSSC